MFCVPIFQATQRFDLPCGTLVSSSITLSLRSSPMFQADLLLGFSVFFFVFSVFSSSGSTFALHWGIQSVSTLSKPLAPCINLVFPIFLIVGKICSNRKKNIFLKIIQNIKTLIWTLKCWSHTSPIDPHSQLS